MTPTIPLRVEVSVPRAFYDRYGTYSAVEQALRVQGVFPREAKEIRWRMDVVNMGYVVSYSVPLLAIEQETP